MKVVHKAVAAVVRDYGRGSELLVFRHPLAGVQLPKGTVETKEAYAAAALRELHEESGLYLTLKPQPIGVWHRRMGAGANKDRHLEKHIWHIFALEVRHPLPDHWSHTAVGSPAEEGLVFEFFWRPFGPDLHREVHPLFAPTVTKIQNYFSAQMAAVGT
ncbi:NUDIX domain-containing protein [Rhodobacteraceae bacterium]|nr:NUDIX domain-containing protein [Paracoccaceae bacterium]